MTRTILIIEDNHQNRYLATFLLERHGYAVIAAADGPAGIALARQERPALIILDIQLPGMDGYTVARTLKDDAELKGIPIVAVTSYAMVGDREAAVSAGCDGYLEKPIDPDRFVLELQRLLGVDAGSRP